MKASLLVAASTVALIALASPASAQEHLTPERVFANPSLNGPTARAVTLSPDGELVAYLLPRQDDVDVLDLWAAPVEGGEPFRLVDARALVPDAGDLSEAEVARRERMRISQRGVVEYAWDDQGRFILTPLEGDVFLANREDGSVRRLTETEADEIDAKVSPQGNYVSWVRDQDLVVYDLTNSREIPITYDGEGTTTWATAEFIAQEEMDRDTGYWWSPNERFIAMTRVDESGVDIIPRLDIQGSGATTIEQRYPRAGRPNAVVQVWVHDMDVGDRRQVDLGTNDDIYVARVNWSKDSRTLYVQRQSRDQRTLELLAVNPRTGESRVILTETNDHWVDLTHDFTPLSDGGFLWSSDRDGNLHLYRYAADGTLINQVTQGDWPVRGVERVDEETGLVWFAASIDDPTQQHLYVTALDGTGEPQQVTHGQGWWSIDVGEGGVFVGNYSDPSTPPNTALYDAGGERLRWLEANALDESHPYWPYVGRHTTPTYGTIRAEDGSDLWYQILTPPDFDPTHRYPAIIEVYGGPGVQRVTRTWQSLASRLYLEAGYVVFRLDNRGSSNRSAGFQTALDRHLGTVEVDDQLTGLEWLRSQPFVDPERVGVTGWSYGGFMTLMMMTDPRFNLAAGASGAPVSEWSLYDTHYTERFMGTPEGNAEGYAASDVLNRLENLEGRLLIMHGMADDNVIFEHATRVINGLQERSQPFEMMLWPGQRHGVRGNPRQLLQWRTWLDFFGRELGSGEN
ncbi:S9 family peptidase [Brevundimonas aveniformis]|uniref:S9 family peptidase n=1 Tax=Brevundimonas aveniformis TaxID=370977 RepID=UPI00040010E0|nr:S9 family peptidase [Brevundimonas aveniformis]